MFDLSCDWKSGYAPNPSRKQRIGYLTDFEGLGLPAGLAKDLTVAAPAFAPTYSRMAVVNGQVSVAAVIEYLSWNGGPGDAIALSFYTSVNNARLLKSKLQNLVTNVIKPLGWWVANYDEETKQWFEESYPVTPKTVSGQVNAPGAKDVRLQIADDPIRVSPNTDVSLYNVYMELVPSANQQCSLLFASSASVKIVKNWGLVIGGIAKGSAAKVGV